MIDRIGDFFSFPLVVRELRSQARTKSTYWLRVLVAGGLLMPILFMGLADGFRSMQGNELFTMLSCLVFYGLMLVGPIVASASITSEKEGATLGLLFLSPLRSIDIIAGKFASNVLRLLAIAVAGTPVFAVAFVYGGVTWSQVAGVAITLLALLVMIVATGILASAICSKTHPASTLTCGYVLGVNLGWWLLVNVLRWEYRIVVPDWLLLISPACTMGEIAGWSRSDYLLLAGETLGVACLEAMVFLGVAAWWLPKTLSMEGSAKKGVWWRISRLRFGVFKRYGAKIRNSNPIFWLDWRQRNLAEIVALVTFFGLLIWWMFKLFLPGSLEKEGFAIVGMWLSVPCHILIAVLAVGHLCRQMVQERRERKLELLLCTPLEDREIAANKFKAAWWPYGILYLLFTAPMLVGGLTLLGQSKSESEIMFIILLESIQDPFFFAMLIGISFWMSLTSNTATEAILKSIGLVAGGFIVWWFAFVAIMIAARGRGGKEAVFIGFAAKFFVVVVVWIAAKRRVVRILRDRAVLGG